MSRINSLPDAKSREMALAITTPIEPVNPVKIVQLVKSQYWAQ